MNERTDGRTNRRTDGRTDEGTKEGTKERTTERTNKRTDGFGPRGPRGLDGRIRRRTNELTYGRLNE